MTNEIILTGNDLTFDDIASLGNTKTKVTIAPEVSEKLARIRSKLEILALSNIPHYGINTGFGALATKKIPKEQLNTLQKNLILSHSVGVGEPLSFEESRTLMLLRANTLAKGHSGCRPVIVDYLVKLLNANCAGLIPSKGSVGASGDLAPLAHQALLLIGEGEAMHHGTILKSNEALSLANLTPLTLEAKEGLALINGTQCMCARGSIQLLESKRLAKLADLTGSMSADALLGSKVPFDPRIHKVRGHVEQQKCAANLYQLLSESELNESHKTCSEVQDPYSLRCMPQVHGASRQVISHVERILLTEINAATDNPLVFETNDGLDILSGGNFHGQPIALALDSLCMAVAELANISDRRIELLLNPEKSRGLPAFLSPNPGLNSGFMMLQVTAAALINENKILCHPASVDSIPTSAGQEDHVSMGMTSANKLKQVVKNTEIVLAIELMCAAQALDLRHPLKSSVIIMGLHDRIRDYVTFADSDRNFGEDLNYILANIRDITKDNHYR